MNDKFDNMLGKYGVSRNSDFYDYIKRRMMYEERLQEIINSFKMIVGYRIPEELEELEELNKLMKENREILNTRYNHYTMLRNYKEKGTVEKTFDKDGKTYMDGLECRTYDHIAYAELGDIMRDMLSRNIDKVKKEIEDEHFALEQTLQYDKKLLEITIQYDEVNGDMRRHYTSKDVGKIQMLNDAVKNIKNMEPGKALAAILGVGVAIVGINYCSTLNMMSDNYSMSNYAQVKVERKVDNSYQQSNHYQETTPTKPYDSSVNNRTISTFAPQNTGEINSNSVSDLNRTVSNTNAITSSVYDSTNQITQNSKVIKSALESSVDSMSPEFTSLLADAILEGNKNIPNNIYSGHYISDIGKSDQEIVCEYFKILNSMLNDKMTGDNASYQLPSVLDTVLRYYGMLKYDKPMDKINLYIDNEKTNSGLAKGVTLQEFRVTRSKGVVVKERLRNAYYAKRKTPIDNLMIGYGTMYNLIGNKRYALVGFGELDDTWSFNEAKGMIKDSLTEVLHEITELEHERDYDER